MRQKIILSLSPLLLFVIQSAFSQNAYRSSFSVKENSVAIDLVMHSDDAGYLFKKIDSNNACFLFFSLDGKQIYPLANGINKKASTDFTELTGINLSPSELEGTVAFCASKTENQLTLQLLKANQSMSFEQKEAIATIQTNQVVFPNNLVAKQLTGREYHQLSLALTAFSTDLVVIDETNLAASVLRDDHFQDFSALIPTHTRERAPTTLPCEVNTPQDETKSVAIPLEEPRVDVLPQEVPTTSPSPKANSSLSLIPSPNLGQTSNLSLLNATRPESPRPLILSIAAPQNNDSTTSLEERSPDRDDQQQLATLVPAFIIGKTQTAPLIQRLIEKEVKQRKERAPLAADAPLISDTTKELALFHQPTDRCDAIETQQDGHETSFLNNQQIRKWKSKRPVNNGACPVPPPAISAPAVEAESTLVVTSSRMHPVTRSFLNDYFKLNEKRVSEAVIINLTEETAQIVAKFERIITGLQEANLPDTNPIFGFIETLISLLKGAQSVDDTMIIYAYASKLEEIFSEITKLTTATQYTQLLSALPTQAGDAEKEIPKVTPEACDILISKIILCTFSLKNPDISKAFFSHVLNFDATKAFLSDTDLRPQLKIFLNQLEGILRGSLSFSNDTCPKPTLDLDKPA